VTKRAAFLLAGVITSAVLVLALGVASRAGWFSQPAAAAETTDPPAAATDVVCVDPADLAALQGQVKDYQAALQQANTQLQAAYDEIAALQTRGRFSGEREANEHGSGSYYGFDDD
jgi:Tfp pilus assembly protein FimV